MTDSSQPQCMIFNKLQKNLFGLNFLWYIVYIEGNVPLKFWINRVTFHWPKFFYKWLPCYVLNLKARLNRWEIVELIPNLGWSYLGLNILFSTQRDSWVCYIILWCIFCGNEFKMFWLCQHYKFLGCLFGSCLGRVLVLGRAS